MKRIFLAFVALVPACSQQIQLRPPQYKGIEVYLSEYHLGPNNGARFFPNFDLWRSASEGGMSTGGESGTNYRVTISYAGREQDGDSYDLQITHPDPKGGPRTEGIHTIFCGAKRECWRDDAYAIGIRLRPLPSSH